MVTLFAAILPALMFPPLLSLRHAPATAACLVIAAAVSIWGCARAWRIGLRLGDDGLTVRNYRRTYRIGWPEVGCFADGSVNGGNAGRLWALCIVLRGGHRLGDGEREAGCPPGDAGGDQAGRRALRGIGGADRDGDKAGIAGITGQSRPLPLSWRPAGAAALGWPAVVADSASG